LKRTSFLFPVMSIIFGLLVSIILLEAVFRMLPVSDVLPKLPVDATNPIRRFKESSDILWTIGATFSTITRKGINNYGFLNDQDYSVIRPSPLLAIIGDSYVEAAQVENKDAMHGILATKITGKGSVYSFGSSGSQLPTYLAYARYVKNEFRPDAFVFIIVGNDFDESFTRYRSAPGFHYFTDTTGRLELVRKDHHPSLIKRLLRRSALVRYMVLNLQIKSFVANLFAGDNNSAKEEFVGNTQSSFNDERISSSKAVVDAFFDKLPAHTGVERNKILFVIDGMRPHLYNPASLMKANGSYFDLMRNYFLRIANDKGYEVIDMQPYFITAYKSNGTRFEFPSDAHWNESGHALVADKISQSNVYQELFGN